MSDGSHGESGPTIRRPSFEVSMALSALFGITVYNCLEIFVFIFRTFHRRRGLYFWSALCATVGTLLFPIFCLLRFLGVANPGVMASLISVSWATIVTSQSLMLYSRLHLVLCDPKKTHWLLAMIVCVFIFIEIPVGVLFAVNNYPFTGAVVAAVYNTMEKIELVIFTIQESLLSGLYLYEWVGVRKELEITKGPRVRTCFYELILLFVMVLVLNLSLVGLQFANEFIIQVTYKPLVYSIKLKVEIYVLKNLVALLNSGNNYQQGLPFRDQILLNSTPENDPGLFQNIHNATRGTDRQGSDTNTKCGSLSTTPSNNTRVPGNSMGV
ncbi:hypothetical protein NPX13_g9555 [Xylaria arbuscula]|uniref:DUF7703 domain-containing protein n=1 Tax=Xylaria arbuscula TaxID=114810 RepID=A0A9W8N6Q2_9PEZI|nr:hypothetical protein NPX13_g9555 [Xylaria arbuscula]